MFKRLREKLVEEAAKQSPLRMPSINATPATLPTSQAAESSSSGSGGVISLQPENSQFSITEDDGTSSEMGSPLKQSDKATTEVDQFLFSVPEFDRGSYVPPSDLESEVEDVGQSLTLDDNITKEQLFFALQRLHARVQRYKAKYSKVAIACKETNNEKEKILRTLTDNQDRALRRLGELKEQCNLEQQAKAHLEENLRVMLDEKDQHISVLQTKVQLLKSGQNVVDNEQVDDQVDTATDDDTSQSGDLHRKVKRLEELLTRCKDALQSNKERSAQLAQERDQLANQLEQKEKELQHVQEHEGSLQARLRAQLDEAHKSLDVLKSEQEESSMAMAETKCSFHQELELREQKLSQAQTESTTLTEQINNLKLKVQEQSVKNGNLEEKMQTMAINLEKEKDELVAELSRGKTAALDLLKETHANDLDMEAQKLRDLQSELDKLQQLNESLKVENLEATVKQNEFEDLKSKSENCDILKGRIAELEGQVEANMQSSELEIAELRSSNSELTENVKTFQETITQLNNDLQTAETCRTQLEKKVEVKSVELATVPDDLIEAEAKMKEKRAQEYQTSELRITELENSNSELSKDLRKLQSTFAQLENDLTTAEMVRTELEKTCEEKSAALTTVQDDLIAVERKMQEQVQEFENSELRIKELEDCNAQLTENVRTLQGTIVALREDLTTAEIQRTELGLSVEANLIDLETKMKEREQELKSEIENLIDQKTLIVKEQGVLQNKLQNEEIQLAQLQQNIKEKDSIIESLNFNSATLEEQSETLSILQTNLATLEKQCEGQDFIISQLKQENLTKQSDIETALENVERRGTELDQIKTERNTLQNQLTEVCLLKESIKSEFEANITELQRKDEVIASLTLNSKSLEETIETLAAFKEENSKQELLACQLRQENQSLKDSMEEKGHLQAGLEMQIAEANRNLQNSVDSIHDLEMKLTQINSENETLISDKSASEQKLGSTVENLQHQLHAVQSVLTELTRKKAEIETQVTELNRTIQDKDVIIENLKINSSSLESKNERLCGLEQRIAEQDSIIIELGNQSHSQKEEFQGVTSLVETSLHSIGALNELSEIKKCNDFASKIKLLMLYVKSTNEQLDSWQSKCQILETKVSDQISVIGDERAAIEAKVAELEQELQQKDIDLQERIVQLNSATSELISLRELLKVVEKQLEDACDQLGEKITEITQLRQNLKELHIKDGDLQCQLNNSISESNELRALLNVADTKIADFRDQLAAKAIDDCDSQRNLQDLRQKYTAALSEVDTLKASLQVVKQQFEDSCDQLGAKVIRVNQLECNLEELQKKYDNAEFQLNNATSQVDELRSRLNVAETLIADTCDKLEVKSLADFDLQQNLLAAQKKDQDSQSEESGESEAIELRLKLDNSAIKEATLLSEITELRSQLENITSKYELVEVNKQHFISEMETKAETCNNLQSRLGEQENLLEERFATIANCQEEISELALSLEAEKSLNSQMQENLNSSYEELDSLKEELRLRANQLDESLIVAQVNSTSINQGLEESKLEIERLEQQNSALKDQLSKAESDMATPKDPNATEDAQVTDFDIRLKQLVKDFATQMQEKEDEHEKLLNETIDRYRHLEDKVHYQKDEHVIALEKQLTEQTTALEEMREHFVDQLQEKDQIISKLSKDKSGSKLDSDWDNAWEDDPDEEVHHTTTHSPRLELQEVSENHRHLSENGGENHLNNSSKSNSFLEPTEFEYLRNILMEYMMGKEPLTLAKVISAVLRFPEQQTNEILQREEAKQSAVV